MVDHSLEQPTKGTDQVVETPRSRTWSAQEECVEGRWGDLGEGHDPCGVQIAIKHPQHLVLDIVPAVQGPRLACKSGEMWCAEAPPSPKPGLQCNSSPTPRAPPRGAVTSTFSHNL